ncbi:hypothetical protein GGE68_002916 [Rhizobium leguminosarum]|uniref:hypothetical protein n=1 Tax=Rhizobium leguminosarum TaxID=384 RepID=UPI00161C7FF7|nr:hypothetical protein [Rhizobium leguminosarum]MBB5664719.1 hypothetical protein [Rhizobium leguminosarum]
MEIFVTVTAWIFSGAMGSMLAVEFLWRRGSSPLDVDIGDIGFFSLLALAGPLNLIVGVLIFVGWLYRKAFRACGIDTSTIVFKARRP